MRLKQCGAQSGSGNLNCTGFDLSIYWLLLLIDLRIHSLFSMGLANALVLCLRRRLFLRIMGLELLSWWEEDDGLNDLSRVRGVMVLLRFCCFLIMFFYF